MKIKVSDIVRHVLLAFLAVVWLIPIVWLLATSFSKYTGMNSSTFFPEEWSIDSYRNLLFGSDTVAQFPNWFWNTFIIAVFTCIISTAFVLMVAYATSCMRFRGRKTLMNIAVIINLFPGVLAMIAVYFILKSIGLTNSHLGLIFVYSASSGLGYLIAKGFLDTVPVSLREAAYLDGASEAKVFWRVVMPMSKPIIARTPGNRLMITAIFISVFLPLKRIQDVAYATMSTKAVEIIHVKQAMINVFQNHCGNWATESAPKSRFL